MLIPEALSFDDVMLVPQQSELASRKDADISGRLVGDYWLSIPIIAANMPSVTNADMALAMFVAGAYGVLHRFQSIEDQISQLKACISFGTLPEDVGVSIGVKDTTDHIAYLIDECDASTFFLDVAHADSRNVFKALNAIETVYYTSCIEVVVGNIATRSAARTLLHGFPWISGLKVGVGPGAACTTREVTGFGVPQWSAIKAVRDVIDDMDLRTTLIADGGCKNSGDIVKALAIGADTVMVGRLLAGCDEAPEPGVYYGSASAHVNGHNAPEGEYGSIERTGPVEDVIKKLAWGIRSGVSYGGGQNLEELRENAMWQRVSPLSAIESGVRL